MRPDSGRARGRRGTAPTSMATRDPEVKDVSAERLISISSKWENKKTTSPACDQFSMHNDEKAVLLAYPVAPRFGDRLEFVVGTQAVPHRLVGQGRGDDSVG